MALKKELLDLLVCPRCRQPLAEKAGALECGRCRLLYPVRDGIPVLLPDAAEKTGASTEDGGKTDGDKA